MASGQSYSYVPPNTSGRTVWSSQNRDCIKTQTNDKDNSRASLDSKKKNLVNKINRTAGKILELRGVLMEESLQTDVQFDPTLLLDPLVRRFNQQVELVSSTNCVYPYHKYLEGLPQFLGQVDTHKDKDDLSNYTYNKHKLPIPYANDSVYRDSSSLLNFEERPIESTNQKKCDERPEFSSRTNQLVTKNRECAQTSEVFSDSEEETDSITAFYPHTDVVDTYYAKEKSGLVKPKYSSSPDQSLQDKKTENMFNGTGENNTNNYHYHQSNSSDRINNKTNAKNTHKDLKDVSSDVETSQSDTVDIRKNFTEGYTKFRKNRRCRIRPKLDGVFPKGDSEKTSKENYTLLQVPTNNISVHKNPSSVLCGESTGSPSWANHSKHANESWYEFKERCSSSFLQQQRSLTKSSSSSTTFQLKDYMPDSNQSTPRDSGKKTVKFSDSSSSSILYTNRYRQTHSSDSSSDDDPGFNVKQFPCLDRREWSGEYLSIYPDE